MSTDTCRRLTKASVFVGTDDAPFVVAETPSEVADLLTEANAGDWNSKPLFVRTSMLTAVCPPKDQPEDEDED